jgi:hypothetical protein
MALHIIAQEIGGRVGRKSFVKHRRMSDRKKRRKAADAAPLKTMYTTPFPVQEEVYRGGALD